MDALPPTAAIMKMYIYMQALIIIFSVPDTMSCTNQFVPDIREIVIKLSMTLISCLEYDFFIFINNNNNNNNNIKFFQENCPHFLL